MKFNKYREVRGLCLKCGTPITPKISHRRFCLMCGIKHFEIIRFLNRLNKLLTIWGDLNK